MTGTNKLAWNSVDVPVPIVVTADLEPGRFLCKRIQQFCFDQGVQLLVADIE